jgi:Zn-dependent protease with chaperone function
MRASPRLNPFAFPSDTDFRFALMIVSVLGAAIWIYDLIVLDSLGGDYAAAVLACLPSRGALGSAELAEAIALGMRSIECQAALNRTIAGWILLGLTILLGAAAAIYWILPLWRIRRGRLQPLTSDEAPGVIAYLDGLREEAGLVRAPAFLWNPLDGRSSGVAFGRFGKPAVALSGGLVTQFYLDRAAFRAVVLHELAHIRNGDVTKTYLAISVWLAFAVAALLPLGVVLADQSLDWILNVGLRALAFAALIYLMRNAVLRAREIYADARAAAWEGPSGGLARVIEALPAPTARWRQLLDLHPDPRERRLILRETGRLFRAGYGEAFVTGLASMIVLPNVVLLVSLLTAQPLLAPLVGAAVFAPLAVGIVGLAAWRATFAALVGGEAPADPLRLGLALGVGALAGLGLSFGSATDSIEERVSRTDLLVADLVWAVLLIGTVALFLRWLVTTASLWLPVSFGDRSPRRAYAVVLTIAAVVLAALYGVLLTARDTAIGILEGGGGVERFLGLVLLPLLIYVMVIGQPAAVAVFASLWALPLATWFWRYRLARTLPRWAFTEPPTRPPDAPAPPSLELGTAVRAALVAAIAFAILHLMMRFAWRSATAMADGDRVALFYASIALAAVMQAVVAAVVASRVERLALLQGLFAAFLAGAGMSLAFIALVPAFGGSIDLEFLTITFTHVVNSGSLLALVVLLVRSRGRLARRSVPARPTTREPLEVSVGTTPR